MPARSSSRRSRSSSPKPSARHRAEARRILAAAGVKTDADAAPLLGGNWRPPPIPTAAEFVSHCLIVEKETGSLVPFVLWPEQQRALAEMQEHEFVCAVKGRQIGITWLVLALMAYEGTFWGHRAFPIARQSEEYAQDAIRRLLILWGYDPDGDVADLAPLPESPMPAEWRPRIITKNVKELRAANGSSWTAHTATRSLGRGLIGYRGLADEFAFWPWPAPQRKAMESGCARLDIISTGNGEGDDFHETWKLAEQGKGKYRPLFISATADPRRDEAWFRQNVEEDADPDGAAREYARRPEDAFRAPEGAYFKRFSRADNVREFDVVKDWRTETCVDWGLGHPAALFIQVSPSGQPFVFDEYLPTDEPKTSEFGQGILGVLGRYNIAAKVTGPYADPAGKARNMQSKLSDFAIFRDLGMNPIGVSSKVYDGCVLMRESVAGDPDRRLIVHPRCVGLISALTNVKPHPREPDVYDHDHEIYSHPLDALRYWHVNRYRRKAAADTSVATVPGRRSGTF